MSEKKADGARERGALRGSTPIPVQFPYRNTGMGGRDDIQIFTLNGEELEPRVHLTKSGSHGTLTFLLVPQETYIFWKISASNSGNLYISAGKLKALPDGEIQKIEEYELFHGHKLIRLLTTLPPEYQFLQKKDVKFKEEVMPR